MTGIAVLLWTYGTDMRIHRIWLMMLAAALLLPLYSIASGISPINRIVTIALITTSILSTSMPYRLWMVIPATDVDFAVICIDIQEPKRSRKIILDPVAIHWIIHLYYTILIFVA